VPLVSVDSLSLSLSRPSLPVSLLTGSLPFPAPPRRPLATPLVTVSQATVRAITTIPFTGLIDASCRVTV